jgi:hypothetical protein
MTPVELAAEARAHVARVIASLERPTIEALDRSAADLASAKERIEQVNQEQPGQKQPGDCAALQSALVSLSKDLRLAGLLLRRAWEFRAAAFGQAGYTPAGEISPEIVSANRWILEG